MSLNAKSESNSLSKPRRRGAFIGATGLVGHALMSSILKSPETDELITIARRPIAHAEHPAWTQMMIPDFAELAKLELPPDLDFAFSGLGSTFKQAGTAENFRRIDFDYNLAFAQKAREYGVSHFILLSAEGANARSRFLYPRVKGELEEAIARLGFNSLTIVRPGLLMGDRREHRLAEKIAIQATRALTTLTGPRLLKSFATPLPDLVECLKSSALNPAPPGLRCIRAREI